MSSFDYKQYAQQLVDKELTILPVRDKVLNIKEWQNLRADGAFNSKYEYFWNNANGIGLSLGEASDIICLDIDILEGDERLSDIREELLGMLPPVFCGLSGHNKKPVARLYRYNGERNEKFKSIDVEILSTGNYKVIPPSVHPITKETYKWVGTPLDAIDVDDLPYLPELLLNYLRSKNDEMRLESRRGGSDITLTAEKGRSKHGSHNYISQKVVRLFHQGYKFEDMVDEAIILDKSINSGKDDVPYFLCPSRTDFRSDKIRLNAIKFVSEVIFRNVYRRYDENNFFKEEIINGFTVISDKGKANRQHISLYNYLKINNDPWYCPEIKSFMIWDGKKYDMRSEDYIRQFAQKNFKNPSCISMNDKSTFLDYAKNEQQGYISDFTIRDNGMINLANGIYDIKAGELRKHSKKYRMPYLIDVNFVENDAAPVWCELLDLITMNRDHMSLAIEEFIGYCISGCDYKAFNKLLILDGAGSNGKSTLVRVIQSVLGAKNTSSVSLTAITKERFAGFNLVNKLANFCSEEPKEAFSDTGILKKLTGGDSIMVEEKHKGAFQYDNLAKFIISYNKMPFFPDDSLGMRRRIILIPCEQNLEVNPELKIQNVNEKIGLEIPQILYRCIRAYQGVISRGHFTHVTEGDKRVSQMIIESNSVLEFMHECIEITGGADFVSSAALWDEFRNFTGGVSHYSKNGFISALKHAFLKSGGGTIEDRKRIDGKQHRGFSGIRVK